MPVQTVVQAMKILKHFLGALELISVEEREGNVGGKEKRWRLAQCFEYKFKFCMTGFGGSVLEPSSSPFHPLCYIIPDPASM